jgi:hypothetical protein
VAVKSRSTTIEPSPALLLWARSLGLLEHARKQRSELIQHLPLNAEVSYIQYISIPAERSSIIHFDSFAGLLSP